MPENVITLASTTAPQLRLSYDSTYYTDLQTGSDGSVTATPTGAAGAVMPWVWAQQDGIIQKFPTGETDRAFNMTLWSSTNPDSGASGRDDWVMRWGYNIAKGGGRANTADHSLAIEMENYWYQAGSGYWTEFHAAYTSKNDTDTRRLWSWLIDVDADTCQMYFQSGSYEFRDFAGVDASSRLSINSTRVTTPLSIVAGVNNTVALYGRDSDGSTEVPIAKVNGSDVIELGAASYPCRVPQTLYVGDLSNGPTSAAVTLYGAGASDHHLLTFDSGVASVGMRWLGSDPTLRARVLGDSIGLYWETSVDSGATYTRRFSAVAGRLHVGTTTTNANQTVGLTINQGSADDQILTLKSSDIAHGITTIAETDTFFAIAKYDSTQGGVLVDALSGGTNSSAFVMRAAIGAISTARTTGATGAIDLRAALKSGTGLAALGTDGNLLVIRNNALTRFIFDGEGDLHADATLNASAFDAYADAEMTRAFDLAVSDPRTLIRSEFDDALRYGRADVERAGLASFGDDGSVFVNYMQLARLHNGAIAQEAGRVRRLEAALRSLLEQNPTLAGRDAAAGLLN